MIERIINPETNQVIERPYTAEEITEVNKAIAEAVTFQTEQAAKAKQKAAILERLGLTEDELKVVLNG